MYQQAELNRSSSRPLLARDVDQIDAARYSSVQCDRDRLELVFQLSAAYFRLRTCAKASSVIHGPAWMTSPSSRHRHHDALRPGHEHPAPLLSLRFRKACGALVAPILRRASDTMMRASKGGDRSSWSNVARIVKVRVRRRESDAGEIRRFLHWGDVVVRMPCKRDGNGRWTLATSEAESPVHCEIITSNNNHDTTASGRSYPWQVQESVEAGAVPDLYDIARCWQRSILEGMIMLAPAAEEDRRGAPFMGARPECGDELLRVTSDLSDENDDLSSQLLWVASHGDADEDSPTACRSSGGWNSASYRRGSSSPVVRLQGSSAGDALHRPPAVFELLSAEVCCRREVDVTSSTNASSPIMSPDDGPLRGGVAEGASYRGPLRSRTCFVSEASFPLRIRRGRAPLVGPDGQLIAELLSTGLDLGVLPSPPMCPSFCGLEVNASVSPLPVASAIDGGAFECSLTFVCPACGVEAYCGSPCVLCGELPDDSTGARGAPQIAIPVDREEANRLAVVAALSQSLSPGREEGLRSSSDMVRSVSPSRGEVDLVRGLAVRCSHAVLRARRLGLRGGGPFVSRQPSEATWLARPDAVCASGDTLHVRDGVGATGVGRTELVMSVLPVALAYLEALEAFGGEALPWPCPPIWMAALRSKYERMLHEDLVTCAV